MGVKRSATVPTRLQQFPSPSDDHALSGSDVETLFSHPQVTIACFPTGGSSRPSSSSMQKRDPGSALPWVSRNERIVASGQIELYRLKSHGNVTFLRSGDLVITFTSRTQCWCIDEAGTFAMNIRQCTYRYDFPYATDVDQQRVEKFKSVLRQFIVYERTDCPFDRGYKTDLVDQFDVNTPLKVTPWSSLQKHSREATHFTAGSSIVAPVSEDYRPAISPFPEDALSESAPGPTAEFSEACTRVEKTPESAPGEALDELVGSTIARLESLSTRSVTSPPILRSLPQLHQSAVPQTTKAHGPPNSQPCLGLAEDQPPSQAVDRGRESLSSALQMGFGAIRQVSDGAAHSPKETMGPFDQATKLEDLRALAGPQEHSLSSLTLTDTVEPAPRTPSMSPSNTAASNTPPLDSPATPSLAEPDATLNVPRKRAAAHLASPLTRLAYAASRENLRRRSRQQLRHKRSLTPDYLRNDSFQTYSVAGGDGVISQAMALLTGPPTGLVQILMMLATRIANGALAGADAGAWTVVRPHSNMPGRWYDSDEELDDTGDQSDDD